MSDWVGINRRHIDPAALHRREVMPPAAVHPKQLGQKKRQVVCNFHRLEGLES